MRYILSIILFLLWISQASALVSQSFAWSASTGTSIPTGYKVCYGTVSGSYSTCTDFSLTLAGTVTGLTEGVTYYFVVIAYNGGGDSAPSIERTVVATAPVENRPMPFYTTVTP